MWCTRQAATSTERPVSCSFLACRGWNWMAVSEGRGGILKWEILAGNRLRYRPCTGPTEGGGGAPNGQCTEFRLGNVDGWKRSKENVKITLTVALSRMAMKMAHSGMVASISSKSFIFKRVFFSSFRVRKRGLCDFIREILLPCSRYRDGVRYL
jgi:hypothetical protein